MAQKKQQTTSEMALPAQPRRRRYLLCAVIFLAALGGWMLFRPIMVALGVWEGPVNTALQRAQVINVIYLLLVNGLWSTLVLGAATVFGAGILAPTKASEGQDRLWFGLQSLGVGLVTLSLATFGLGVLGLLRWGVFIALLLGMALVGSGLWIWCRRRGRIIFPPTNYPGEPFWPWVALMVPAALVVLATLVPAGVLWAHDGRGFDVLEYHLQLPKEYLQAGRIFRVDHNAYSHFPQNMEMLYLVALILRGDPVEGMYLAQIIHLAVCAAFVLGVFSLVRRWSRSGGVLTVAAVVGGPLVYVATIAYNEGYLLLMMLLAVGAVLPGSGGKLSMRQAALAGVFLGGACGAKYTAVAMAGSVVFIFVVLVARARGRQVALIILAALLVFSPWLIKNLIWNSNPVFPLAAKTLGQSDWSDEQVARWNSAHAPAPDETAVSVRLTKLVRELFDPGRYGGCIWPLVLLVGVWLIKRNRQTDNGPPRILFVAAAISFAVQMIIWLAFTHLQSRFLLPMLVPLAVMIGYLAGCCGWSSRIFSLLTISVILVHTIFIARSYSVSTTIEGDGGFAPLAGADSFVASLYPFNDSDNPDLNKIKILLMGESRPFYTRSNYVYHTVFDRCALQEQLAAGATPADIAAVWHSAGITHVYVRWDEIERLRRSYGFAPRITPEFFQRMQPKYLEKINEQSPAFELLPGELYRLKP